MQRYIEFVISKKIEMKRRRSQGEHAELPPSVEKGVQRAGGFEKILRSTQDEEMFEALSRTYDALSDKIRIKILVALSMSDLCPCLIKKIIRIADSKMSYHLRILEGAGLIKSARKGRWVIYSLTKKGAQYLRLTVDKLQFGGDKEK